MSLFLLIAFLLPLLSLVLQAAAPGPLMRFILYGIAAASPSIAAIVLLVKNRACHFSRKCSIGSILRWRC